MNLKLPCCHGVTESFLSPRKPIETISFFDVKSKFEKKNHNEKDF